MDNFAKKLSRVLRAEFPKAVIVLDPIPESSRYTGFLIWEQFAGVEPIDRQNQLWKVLQDNLSDDERQRLSGLFTITNDERMIMRENATAA